MHYYNEYDAKTAAWLRELIGEGWLPRGEVDERSIADVSAADLAGYGQCHFFAGIGGWPLALALAGWPEDRVCWTGSCPCQPFSVAGKGRGEADERHLWPVFRELIRECRPAVVFGEQVASAAGRDWLAGVRADLEAMAYAVGAADLCAAGIGAPHLRQRLYWVADGDGERCRGRSAQRECQTGPGAGIADGGADGRVADAGHESEGRLAGSGETQSGRAFGDAAGRGTDGRMAGADEGKCGRVADGKGCQRDGAAAEWDESNGQSESLGDPRGVAHRDDAGSQGRECGELSECAGECAAGAGGASGGMGVASVSRFVDAKDAGASSNHAREGARGQQSERAVWADSRLIACRDGKSRRVPAEPAFFPLADGVSAARVGILRGAGNAIVPQVAAEFIAAFGGGGERDAKDGRDQR